jgi:hypothetical protein
MQNLYPFRLKQDMKTQDHESIQRKQLGLCGDKMEKII